MHSCIYDGEVRHRRFQPIRREFRYRIAFLFLDLAELDQVWDQLWFLGRRRFSLASIYRPDHFGAAAEGLEDAVRRLVAERTGARPTGPIRLLTQWRTLGYYFSPINLFFCYGHDGQVDTIVAEVNNTPWREQHAYVLWSGNRVSECQMSYRHAKEFHVSPFMDMNLEYDWQLRSPAEEFGVQLKTFRDTSCLFDASLQMCRRELTNRTWLSTFIRYPVPAARILTVIYYEAWRLWLKKCPFYPHPSSSCRSTVKETAESSNVVSKVG